jgi:hypothetical protein
MSSFIPQTIQYKISDSVNIGVSISLKRDQFSAKKTISLILYKSAQISLWIMNTAPGVSRTISQFPALDYVVTISITQALSTITDQVLNIQLMLLLWN